MTFFQADIPTTKPDIVNLRESCTTDGERSCVAFPHCFHCTCFPREVDIETTSHLNEMLQVLYLFVFDRMALLLGTASPTSDNLHSIIYTLFQEFTPTFNTFDLTKCSPSVLRHCWLGDRKGIRPVKVGCRDVGGDDLTGALYVL